MGRLFIMLGCLGAALSVMLGAFGAHALENHLSEYYLEIYHTGVEYQMSHSLGLILIGVIANLLSRSKLISAAGWCLTVGIILFSFSLYTIAFTGFSKLGMITPIGGVAFVLGWVLLGVGVIRK